MKDSYLKVAVVAWAAGVIAGSQVSPRRPAPVTNVLRAPAEETPVMRLAAAVVEVGDAAANLVSQKIF
jgi:hypothetical protein